MTASDSSYNWYRDGNTQWVVCPSCGFSFPITEAMARQDKVPCECPNCREKFFPDQTGDKK